MIAEDNTMPIRMGYIICRPPCKTKMQGPCSKGRGKVPLKVLKYQDFPLILLFQPGVVYLLFNECCNSSGTGIPEEWWPSGITPHVHAHTLPTHSMLSSPPPTRSHRPTNTLHSHLRRESQVIALLTGPSLPNPQAPRSAAISTQGS